VVQLSATPGPTGAGAAAGDPDGARSFVRVVFQLAATAAAAAAAAAERAARGGEYRDGDTRQGRRGELDGDPDSAATSSPCGGHAATGNSDADGAGKLLLSRVSAGCWGALTAPWMDGWIVFVFVFSCYFIKFVSFSPLHVSPLFSLDDSVQGLSFPPFFCL